VSPIIDERNTTLIKVDLYDLFSKPLESIINCKETEIITPAMLELMENEVSGPRIPGPVPLSPLYFPFTSNKTALNPVKNYSWDLLHRLVPNPQVIQQGNALRTTVTEEGLTQ
jgi:hypothetical protein